MDRLTPLEGNLEIARFMGHLTAQEVRGCVCYWDSRSNMQEALYHVSWEALMPVLQKIEALGFATKIDYSENPHTESGWYHFCAIGFKEFCAGSRDSKIEAVFGAAALFAKDRNLKAAAMRKEQLINYSNRYRKH